MKSAISLVILGFFLVSCAQNTKAPSPQPSATVSKTLTVIPTVTPVALAPTVTVSITKRFDNTPTTTAPAPISLSPISVENADQIQPLFTYHVPWDALSYGLVAVSPDAKWVALAPKYSSQLYILPLAWTPDRSIIPSIDTASSYAYKFRTESLAFSPDSGYLAVAGENDSVTVYDLEHMDRIKTLSKLDWPSAVTFMKDSKTLVIGTQRGPGGSLEIWDIQTSSLKRVISLDVTHGGICSVAVSPDGSILAAGYCSWIFDISTLDIEKDFAPIARLAGLDEVRYCAHLCTDNRNIIAFNPSTGDIASGTNYDRIPIQNPRTGKLSGIIHSAFVDYLGYEIGPVNSLAFTSDGGVLGIAGSRLTLRNTNDGRLLWSHRYLYPSYASAMAITADSRLLISIDSDGNIEFWGIPDSLKLIQSK